MRNPGASTTVPRICRPDPQSRHRKNTSYRRNFTFSVCPTRLNGTVCHRLARDRLPSGVLVRRVKIAYRSKYRRWPALRGIDRSQQIRGQTHAPNRSHLPCVNAFGSESWARKGQGFDDHLQYLDPQMVPSCACASRGNTADKRGEYAQNSTIHLMRIFQDYKVISIFLCH